MGFSKWGVGVSAFLVFAVGLSGSPALGAGPDGTPEEVKSRANVASKTDLGKERKATYYLYLPDRHDGLIGGRVVHRLKQIPGLSMTGEFAYERGTENSMKAGVPNFGLNAWGGFGYAKQKFNIKFNPYVQRDSGGYRDRTRTAGR